MYGSYLGDNMFGIIGIEKPSKKKMKLSDIFVMDKKKSQVKNKNQKEITQHGKDTAKNTRGKPKA
jgi:hypothetical protein